MEGVQNMSKRTEYGLGNVSTHNNWNNAAATDKTETAVSTRGRTLLSYTFQNKGAAPAYVRLYNKASAPTVGTDTPKWTVMVPVGGGIVHAEVEMLFATGLAYAITSDSGDLGSTGVTNADEVVVNLEYV